MIKGRRLAPLAGVAAALLFFGCSGETTLPGTVQTAEVDITWSPAERLPTDKAEIVSSALESSGLAMIFPSQAPTADSASATFILRRSTPSGEVEAELYVNADDQPSPLISIGTYVGSPRNSLHGHQVRIRGLRGESLAVPGAVSFLLWQEGRQTFQAEYSSLSLIQVLEWLNTWQTLP